MRARLAIVLPSCALAILVTVAGCSSEHMSAPAEGSGVDRATQPIFAPQRDASAYTEGARVKVNNAANDFCSGVVIAPRVVLTAAHCIAFNPTSAMNATRGTWTITAPFAAGGAQVRTVSINQWDTYEPNFTTLSGGVSNYDSHPELHDLGLLYVDTAFTGISFPTLSRTRYPIGASHPQVSAVGRAFVGETAGLVLSQPVAMSGSASGYLNDNTTPVVTNGGDSGGGLFLEGTHMLVGTETRFSGQTQGTDTDWWARLDGNVYDWIIAHVASHGVTTTTLATLRDEVANALCARVASCCNAASPGYTLSSAKCHAIYDQFGFEATARGIQTASAANVTVDTATKDSCIQKIDDETADCSVGTVEVKTAIAHCLSAVTGKLAIGASCTSSLECAGNAVCELDAAGAGTCKALRTAGQSCEIVYKTGTDVAKRDNLAQDLCSKRGGGQSGLYCDAYDSALGAYRTESTWTCKSALADGSGCSTDAYCSSFVCDAASFTCVANSPFVNTNVCTAFAGP
ncbi:MAG: hypothetical protein JWP87_2106 [Labilithrix sp.]|nr:hypothetical protein [Labilithrix sp.]